MGRGGVVGPRGADGYVCHPHHAQLAQRAGNIDRDYAWTSPTSPNRSTSPHLHPIPPNRSLRPAEVNGSAVWNRYSRRGGAVGGGGVDTTTTAPQAGEDRSGGRVECDRQRGRDAGDGAARDDEVGGPVVELDGDHVVGCCDCIHAAGVGGGEGDNVDEEMLCLSHEGISFLLGCGNAHVGIGCDGCQTRNAFGFQVAGVGLLHGVQLV